MKNFSTLVKVFIGVMSFALGIIIVELQIPPYKKVINFLKSNDKNLISASFENVRKVQQKDVYWANEMKKGGYIIHIRHAEREKWDNAVAYDALELIENLDARDYKWARSSCLTDRGIEDAKLIGRVFGYLNIPVNKIISSPSCRARETAIFAFNRIDEVTPSLLHRTAMRAADHIPMAEQLERVVTSSYAYNENIILSGHAGTLSFDIANKVGFVKINNTHNIDERIETGIVIISKDDNGAFTAVHKFESIWQLLIANIVIPPADLSGGKFVFHGGNYDPWRNK
jgi:phosphohistidine phosphatase SixA